MPGKRPRLIAVLVAVTLAVLGLHAVAARSGGVPPYQSIVAKWPFSSVAVGNVDNPAGGGGLEHSAPFQLRYVYLSGGVNTGKDWETWAPNGSWVSDYVNEVDSQNVVPVFSYYEIRQSLPGANVADERKGDIENLNDATTMREYYGNLKQLMMVLAAESPHPVVLQIEPDLWGYIEQQAGTDATSLHAAVASTGLPELSGLPNTAAGFAQAIVKLRNLYAPNVLLGYHLSVFGTEHGITGRGVTLHDVDGLAADSSAFYESLHTPFDLMFAETSNADAGYEQKVLKVAHAFWGPVDYAHQVRYLGDIYRAIHLPTVLWQLPIGNTVYRTENNSPGHYQDNGVQWLLGPHGRAHLRAFMRAGVIALLYGTGVSDGTCACDAQHDGITNPRPIDGNKRVSHSVDDDGGYLVQRTAAYERTGGTRLDPQLMARVKALGKDAGASTPVGSS